MARLNHTSLGLLYMYAAITVAVCFAAGSVIGALLNRRRP